MEPFAAGTKPACGEKVILGTGDRRLQPFRALADRSNQETPTLAAAPADRETVQPATPPFRAVRPRHASR